MKTRGIDPINSNFIIFSLHLTLKSGSFFTEFDISTIYYEIII